MRILKQIIEKKMELSEEHILNRRYLRGIWQFYCCYNLALAILNIKMDIAEMKRRNKTWKKWMLKENVFDEKKFKKMKEFMNKDKEIIIESLKFITKQEEKNPYDFGNIDKPNVVGILSFEMPE